jgi:hypothetical protein
MVLYCREKSCYSLCIHKFNRIAPKYWGTAFHITNSEVVVLSWVQTQYLRNNDCEHEFQHGACLCTRRVQTKRAPAA